MSELVVQTIGTVASNLQATAPQWTIGTERGNDHMTSRPNRVTDLLDVFPPVGLVRKEVEHGAVVPDTKVLVRKISLGNIGFNPSNPLGLATKSCACGLKC